jgi:hypothetical protein
MHSTSSIIGYYKARNNIGWSYEDKGIDSDSTINTIR